jgi:hypothetical protein
MGRELLHLACLYCASFILLVYSFCYTGGDDCIVRLWKTDQGEDQEPPTAIEAGESIMTLAASVRSALPLSFLAHRAHRITRGFPEVKTLMFDNIRWGIQTWKR